MPNPKDFREVFNLYRYLKQGTKTVFKKHADEFIGSGEGAQIYGRGHYSSEGERVASNYAKPLPSLKHLDTVRGKSLSQKIRVGYLSDRYTPYLRSALLRRELNFDKYGAKEANRIFDSELEHMFNVTNEKHIQPAYRAAKREEAKLPDFVRRYISTLEKRRDDLYKEWTDLYDKQIKESAVVLNETAYTTEERKALLKKIDEKYKPQQDAIFKERSRISKALDKIKEHHGYSDWPRIRYQQLKGSEDRAIESLMPENRKNNFLPLKETNTSYWKKIKPTFLKPESDVIAGKKGFINLSRVPKDLTYIDWRKPLPPHLQYALHDIYNSYNIPRNATGEEFYGTLTANIWKGSSRKEMQKAEKDITNMLYERGIHGVRYEANQGNSKHFNYVHFHPKDIEVVGWKEKHERDFVDVKDWTEKQIKDRWPTLTKENIKREPHPGPGMIKDIMANGPLPPAQRTGEEMFLPTIEGIRGAINIGKQDTQVFLEPNLLAKDVRRIASAIRKEVLKAGGTDRDAKTFKLIPPGTEANAISRVKPEVYRRILGASGVAAGATLYNEEDANAMPLGRFFEAGTPLAKRALQSAPSRTASKLIGETLEGRWFKEKQLNGKIIKNVTQGVDDKVRNIIFDDGTVQEIDAKDLSYIMAEMGNISQINKFHMQPPENKQIQAVKGLQHAYDRVGIGFKSLADSFINERNTMLRNTYGEPRHNSAGVYFGNQYLIIPKPYAEYLNGRSVTLRNGMTGKVRMDKRPLGE